jgi:DNA-binding transcriptional regulator YiaG
MSPDEYREALRQIGLSHNGAADLFGVDERTVFRWLRRGPPPPAARLLRLLVLLGLSGDDAINILAGRTRPGKPTERR